MAEMREYSILEPTFDADKYGKGKRITCGSTVVIPLVHSFLWGMSPTISLFLTNGDYVFGNTMLMFN